MNILFNIVLFCFLFILGAVFGSFYNMLIYRLPNELPFIKGRSYCPNCKHTLTKYDLIPIFSFIFQKGKCRYCQTKINIRYLIVELIAAFLAVSFGFKFGNSIIFYKYFIFFSGLLILFFTDYEEKIIPDSISYGLIILGLCFALYEGTIFESIKGAMAGFGIYFIIAILAYWYYKKEAIGGGDVKLGAGIGAFWGLKVSILSTYFSFVFGGAFALLLILTKMKKKTDYIPFAPAIIFGNIFTLLFIDFIWKLYFGS